MHPLTMFVLDPYSAILHVQAREKISIFFVEFLKNEDFQLSKLRGRSGGDQGGGRENWEESVGKSGEVIWPTSTL